MVGAGVGVATTGATIARDGTGGLVSAFCASNSFNFSTTCARAAACAGVSVARRVNGAHAMKAQIKTENFVVCMPLYYANSPPEATAFPADENNFRHANGSGDASSDFTKIQ